MAKALPKTLFVKREKEGSTDYLVADEMERIPEKHRPSGPVMRSHMAVIDMPPFNKVTNRVEVIFDSAAPTQ